MTREQGSRSGTAQCPFPCQPGGMASSGFLILAWTGRSHGSELSRGFEMGFANRVTALISTTQLSTAQYPTAR